MSECRWQGQDCGEGLAQSDGESTGDFRAGEFEYMLDHCWSGQVSTQYELIPLQTVV